MSNDSVTESIFYGCKGIIGEASAYFSSKYFFKVYPLIEDVRGATRIRIGTEKITSRLVKTRTENDYWRTNSIVEGLFVDEDAASYVYREYELAKKLIQETGNAKVFCDIGSYHGFHSVASKADTNYAFEAEPNHFETLKQNIEINPDKDIRPVQKAVWSSEEQLFIEGEKGGGSSISENGSTVQGITLDSFFEERRDPDVIKIDVEGAEFEVLKGAEKTLRRSSPTIIIELHDNGRIEDFNGSRSELESFLKKYCYEKNWELDRGNETQQGWKRKTPSEFRKGGKYA